MKTFTVSGEQRQEWLDALLTAYQILDSKPEERTDEVKEILDELMVEIEDIDPEVRASKERSNVVMLGDRLVDLGSRSEPGE